jgi:hypothetical protein
VLTLKSATRAGALAIAVLIAGTTIAAADQNKAARNDCLAKASDKYQSDKADCQRNHGGKGDEAALKSCNDDVLNLLGHAVRHCYEDYPVTTKPVSDYGVGGPSSTGLDGWHPKGSKTKGLIDPNSLKGADTSGGQGSGGGSNTGGSNGGGGKVLGGTFNSSMSGASMSTGGGSGGIIQ